MPSFAAVFAAASALRTLLPASITDDGVLGAGAPISSKTPRQKCRIAHHARYSAPKSRIRHDIQQNASTNLVIARRSIEMNRLTVWPESCFPEFIPTNPANAWRPAMQQPSEAIALAFSEAMQSRGV